MESIPIDELKSALPDKLRKNVTPSVMARVNAVLADPEVHETYRENLLGYAHVLREGRFKMVNYVDAVKFVSYKLMGKNSKQAFQMVFPEKIAKWEQEGVEGKDQASYITAYNSTKLVSLIYEQTLIPIHVLNRDNYQRAINTQVTLMITAKSELVRTQAANSIMTHLKQPESTKVDINITSETDSAIDALTASTQAMINQQKQAMKQGLLTAEQVAHQSLTVVNTSSPDIEDAEIIEENYQQPKSLENLPSKGLFD